MEGKEYNEDDEKKKNSDSSENNESFDDSESDDFGLPEVENADDAYSDDSSEESYGSSQDDYSYSSDSDYESDYSSESDDSGHYSDQDSSDYDSSQDEAEQQRNYYIHGLDDDDRGGGSSAGWIIGIIIFVIIAAFAVWWFFLREPEKPVVVTPKPKPKAQVEQVVKDTIPKEEPIIKDEPVSKTVPGQVVQLSQPTGRYYVIIASFIDDDLAMDYGNKLAKQGVGSTILNPKTNKGFFRLAVADFVNLKDAALEAERLKSTYGQDVWVIKY